MLMRRPPLRKSTREGSEYKTTTYQRRKVCRFCVDKNLTIWPASRRARVELALVLGRRHEEENAVEIALLRHDALFAEEVGEDGGRHAEVQVLAGPAVDARRQQRELVGIDHRVPVGVPLVPVPRARRVEVPALLLGLDDCGRQILPGHVGHVAGETGSRGSSPRRARTDRRTLFLGILAGALVVVPELPQFLAHLDAQLNAAIPQRLAGASLVDLRVDVQRGEQGVERRRGGVHQERLVEALVLDVAPLAAEVVVALVDLRRLREARPCLCTDWVENSPGISGSRCPSRIGL